MPGQQQLAPAAAQLPGTAGWPGRAGQGRARLLWGGRVCAAPVQALQAALGAGAVCPSCQVVSACESQP